jgi:hypothetical protein
MLPGEAVQLMDSWVVPCTVAVKGRVPFVSEEEEVGEIVTEIPVEDVPLGLVESGERAAALPVHPDIPAAVAVRMIKSNNRFRTRCWSK